MQEVTRGQPILPNWSDLPPSFDWQRVWRELNEQPLNTDVLSSVHLFLLRRSWTSSTTERARAARAAYDLEHDGQHAACGGLEEEGDTWASHIEPDPDEEEDAPGTAPDAAPARPTANNAVRSSAVPPSRGKRINVNLDDLPASFFREPTPEVETRRRARAVTPLTEEALSAHNNGSTSSSSSRASSSSLPPPELYAVQNPFAIAILPNEVADPAPHHRWPMTSTRPATLRSTSPPILEGLAGAFNILAEFEIADAQTEQEANVMLREWQASSLWPLAEETPRQHRRSGRIAQLQGQASVEATAELAIP
ncbi:hypothetical protein CBOM_06273 [Ceraceosorus bombacis]|uniref:Uncharacterized protein n=1 Tax=Ceraceosorus bombacis TaxID=401625 RepID=A0A0P1BRY0_9BASI|nr:hypothetical protein CBOM_06273 [Ceraceosorus bombacis]